MKLEIKHLTPYLPYKLMCQWNQSKPFELKGLTYGNASVSNEMWVWQDDRNKYLQGYLYECKPILRPLSDLHQIKDEIIDANIFYDEALISKSGLDVTFTGFRMLHDFYNTNELPYNIIQVLFNHHFDIFGLIEKGLAIDINTLDEEI